MLTTSPSMTSRSLRHPDLIGLPPAIRHRGHDGNHVFRYQSPMPAGAGTPRYENWLHWLVEGLRCRLCPPPLPWLGTSPSATFLSCDPGLSLFGRQWLVSPAGAGVDFRTNRSSRLSPAHQGMKMRPGRWKCLGVVGATLPLWIPAFAGMTNSVAGTFHFRTKCSDLGVSAPYGRNIAPMRVYHRRGRLFGESQNRVARAKSLTGDAEVSSTTKIPLILARRRGPGRRLRKARG